MADRYARYPPRARSPPMYSPARTSLPTNIAGYAPPAAEAHLHAIPSSRREVITGPRGSNSTLSSGGTVTTTYKIKPEPSSRSGSVREGSRTRSSTIDNGHRPSLPAVITSTPRHRPVIHAAGAARPASPVKNANRSSDEDFVTIPASSRHGHHHHRKRHSSHLDNSDLNRIASTRDGSRLRIAPVREPTYTTRSRPMYSGTAVRRSDNAGDDYGDDGYGYTKPGDLALYDLDHNEPVFRRPRRDSFDAGRANRPTSISGYSDLVARPHDTRERGPPPTTRGFDKIRAPTWDQAQARTTGGPSPLDSQPRSRAFDVVDAPRRSNSRARASTYHDREPRRAAREEIYEVNDGHHRKPHRHERYDDAVEQRGFGIRSDRPDRDNVSEPSEREEAPRRERERPNRSERAEKSERSERSERSDRDQRIERTENDRPHKEQEHKEHKGRDVLATGLSIAGAALGLNAVKNASRDDHDDRDERRRRDEKDETRRDKDEREVVDLSGRNPKERRSRDEENSPPRRMTPTRDTPSPRDTQGIDRAVVNHDTSHASDRNLKDHRAVRDERKTDGEHRHRQKSRRDEAVASSDDDTPPTEDEEDEEDAVPRPRREHRHHDASGGHAAFNPKDTMDLMALKDALNAKDSTPKANSTEVRTRAAHDSAKDAPGNTERRQEVKEERPSREPIVPSEGKQLRVVSPPREKAEEKPVKGILRQPREKFPEDPAPIREGVAPLKDAKKDGIPPDARWTKISRRLVNPEALEAGKERFEAREDFVIVLRVLSKEEVQGYAEITQRIRAAREEQEDDEEQERRDARRAARRARHERHKRERSGEIPRSERSERRHHRRSRPEHHSESHSESDTSDTDYEDDRVSDKPKMIEAPKKKATFDEAVMSGGLADTGSIATGTGALNLGNLRETGPGQYSGYVRNPPPPASMVATVGSRRDER